MQIAILGDSWGEPNWRNPQPGFTAQGHISSVLRRRANVINYSQSGGSNLTTWLNWESRLGLDPCPDWLIWFHTDLARDWRQAEMSQGWHYQTLTDQTAERVYARAQEIYTRGLSPKLILVEGQSCVHEPAFTKYFNPHYWVKDWRSQLLKKAMPPTQIIGPLVGGRDNFIRHCLDSLEQQADMIDRVDTIMTEMRLSDLFVDHCHPGDLAHRELAAKLMRVMTAKR